MTSSSGRRSGKYDSSHNPGNHDISVPSFPWYLYDLVILIVNILSRISASNLALFSCFTLLLLTTIAAPKIALSMFSVLVLSLVIRNRRWVLLFHPSLISKISFGIHLTRRKMIFDPLGLRINWITCDPATCSFIFAPAVSGHMTHSYVPQPILIVTNPTLAKAILSDTRRFIKQVPSTTLFKTVFGMYSPLTTCNDQSRNIWNSQHKLISKAFGRKVIASPSIIGLSFVLTTCIVSNWSKYQKNNPARGPQLCADLMTDVLALALFGSIDIHRPRPEYGNMSVSGSLSRVMTICRRCFDMTNENLLKDLIFSKENKCSIDIINVKKFILSMIQNRRLALNGKQTDKRENPIQALIGGDINEKLYHIVKRLQSEGTSVFIIDVLILESYEMFKCDAEGAIHVDDRLCDLLLTLWISGIELFGTLLWSILIHVAGIDKLGKELLMRDVQKLLCVCPFSINTKFSIGTDDMNNSVEVEGLYTILRSIYPTVTIIPFAHDLASTALPGSELSFKRLQACSYLRAIVVTTTTAHPPFPTILRRCVADQLVIHNNTILSVKLSKSRNISPADVTPIPVGIDVVIDVKSVNRKYLKEQGKESIPSRDDAKIDMSWFLDSETHEFLHHIKSFSFGQGLFSCPVSNLTDVMLIPCLAAILQLWTIVPVASPSSKLSSDRLFDYFCVEESFHMPSNTNILQNIPMEKEATPMPQRRKRGPLPFENASFPSKSVESVTSSFEHSGTSDKGKMLGLGSSVRQKPSVYSSDSSSSR